MSEKHPIGIFDSGFGGLTIFNEIILKLPEYDFIYLGDNARSPYGHRSFEVVYSFTLEAVKKLFDMGCWLVILACNTASAKSLRTIQQKDLPLINPQKRVLGILRPSVEVINLYTKTNHIGIFATEGTVSSESYPIEINKLHPEILTVQEACPMWVPLVENNEHEGPGADYFIEKHVNNILNKDKNIDVILLGCTHYPFLIPKIKKYLPEHIQLLSQDKIVANSLKDYLKRHPEIDIKCSKNSIIEYFTTGSPEDFSKRTEILLGKKVTAKKAVL